MRISTSCFIKNIAQSPLQITQLYQSDTCDVDYFLFTIHLNNNIVGIVFWEEIEHVNTENETFLLQMQTTAC